jgi:UDP-N-acetylmuramoyl-L-alanyl-D-glutamate--2,6-diaminopimelate ligase
MQTKTLQNLIQKIKIEKQVDNLDCLVEKIAFDSREVSPKTLFVATKGTQTDGHNFIKMAIEQGAVAIICEELPSNLENGITYLQVKNSAEALGIVASNFYDNPSKRLKLVGITGTNGKTTTVSLLFELFRRFGYNVGLLSTIQNQINEEVIPSTHTTPNPIELNRLLAQMVAQKCTHVFMEVSSHALVQGRVAGLDFKGGAFTNISHDHLDYHQTFMEYIKAKKLFFDNLSKSAFALVNKDDKRGLVMLEHCKAKAYTFALKRMADFKAKIVENSFEALLLTIDKQELWCRLIGEFNAYNLLTVYGVAILLGEEKEAVLVELSALGGAAGRFERINQNNKFGIVDYAHTPDALENVLTTIQKIRHDGQKIITVVGCGGNRDTQKRPKMAKIAAKYSDKVILTSDNPRNENPESIIEEMYVGLDILDLKKTIKITDRKEAIHTACLLGQSKDIILVAGKGHEPYQEIEGKRYPFDDREMIREFL